MISPVMVASTDLKKLFIDFFVLCSIKWCRSLYNADWKQMLSPAHNNANIANYFNSISICSYKLSPKRKLFLLFLYYYSWFSIGLYNLKPIEWE